MTRLALAALIGWAASGPAWAQVGGQSVTQPSANQNQPQLQSNQAGQAPVAGSTGGNPQPPAQQSQPSANQNQPQIDSNQGQNPAKPNGTTGTQGGR